MAAELQGYESRGAHRADEVRRVVVHRGQPGDAAFGQVLPDDVRRLEPVLVTRELVIGDLDEGWKPERGRVLTVVIVDSGVESERAGHKVSRLITSARVQLNLQRAGWDSRGRHRGAPVVRCPLEIDHPAPSHGLAARPVVRY